MRVAERHREPVETHFTEGEPDLEPPEEMAIGELGEDAMLEEDLDNEDVLEQDVDEDTLEVTLEDLVHGGDDDEEDADADGRPPVGVAGYASTPPVVDDDADAVDDEADPDVEEGLDQVLAERLALIDEGPPDDDDNDGRGTQRQHVALLTRPDTIDFVDVAPCGADEFVCRSCFLVRSRVQLVDAAAMVCRDCSA